MWPGVKVYMEPVTADVEDQEEMKQRLCRVFHRQISMSNNRFRRKLILHFDVNKTVVPVDSATGECVEDALNVYLSGQVWGRETGGEWKCDRSELSHLPLDSDTISFYKYEENRILRKFTADRATFRGQLTTFTDRPQGVDFKPHLDTLLQKLQWNYRYDDALHRSLTVPGRKNVRFHYILPAFYRLLEHLTSEERDFTIVFRTYGTDAVGVLSSLSTALSGAAPMCRNLRHLSDNVSLSLSTLLRNGDGQFELNLRRDNKECFLTSEQEIYDTLTGSSGIWAVRDDVGSWNRGNFHPSSGKPLWVDPADDNVHHIFFDDNIRPGKEDSIVDLRLRDTNGTFRTVSQADEWRFVNAVLCPVNFSSAIMEEDYFVKCLTVCEDGWQSLATGSKLPS